MGAQSRISLAFVAVLGLTALGCGERPATKKGDITPADVIAGSAQALDHYESSEGKFGVDFPPVWKGHYDAVAHSDTAFGSHGIVEFKFKPAAGSKVEPKTLLAIRFFTPDKWNKVMQDPKQNIGVQLKQRGNDVFVLSLAGANPYAKGTPEADLFDQMMLSVMNDAVPLRLTPR
jgi:hypothetical protein